MGAVELVPSLSVACVSEFSNIPFPFQYLEDQYLEDQYLEDQYLEDLYQGCLDCLQTCPLTLTVHLL